MNPPYEYVLPMAEALPVAVLAEYDAVHINHDERDNLHLADVELEAQVRALAVRDTAVSEGDPDAPALEFFVIEPLWVDVEDAGQERGRLDQVLEAAHAEHHHQPARHHNVVEDDLVARGRNAESISSYLFDLIREGCACTSVIGGWVRDQQDCNRVVERCVSHPEEAFYISENGRTPLHEACLRGSCTHVISTLLQSNAMGSSKHDSRGNTPLHLLFVDNAMQILSCIHSDEQIDSIIASLLEFSPYYLASATNHEGNTALHMACMAPESMVPYSSLARLVQANVSVASKVNNHNQTALLLHCQRRNASTEVAQLLYDARPEILSTPGWDNGWAALHYAASNTNLDLLKFLVQGNPDAALVKTLNGETALHLMCQQNLSEDHLPALQIIIQAYPNAVIERDHRRSYTPLHSLCQAGSRTSLEVVKRLFAANPHVAEIADSEHYLPIHHACENGCDASVVQVILDAYPLAANAMTRRQDSALSLACTCNKSVETVKILIQANMSALTKKNDYGFAPLHCVCRAYQPRMGIVETLLDASPNCITLKTHGGETPVHLACSNPNVFIGVLQLLTQNQHHAHGFKYRVPFAIPSMTNKVGNTPLHDACFRGAPFEHIETVAMAHPEWIRIRNHGGLSPFQILCKYGHIDERVVTEFSRMGGPEIFSVIDSTGNTALHSAMREDMDLPTIRCLIRALPDALQLKTIYGDSPLHLACHRRAHPDVVREVALACIAHHQHSPILEPNMAGQTPIGIAMEDFRTVVCRGGRSCWVTSDYLPEQRRAFDILATLVKILYYGTSYEDHKHMSLVRASLALHRKDVQLDPVFIRRAIHVNSEEVRMMDDDKNFPLHIEASIPIEKMLLLDRSGGCCAGECQKRMGILRTLLNLYPAAAHVRMSGGFPLNLMIENGRPWSNEVVVALRAFPPALHWQRGLGDNVLSLILEKVSKECGVDTLFSLLVSRPGSIFGKVGR